MNKYHTCPLLLSLMTSTPRLCLQTGPPMAAGHINIHDLQRPGAGAGAGAYITFSEQISTVVQLSRSYGGVVQTQYICFSCRPPLTSARQKAMRRTKSAISTLDLQTRNTVFTRRLMILCVNTRWRLTRIFTGPLQDENIRVKVDTTRILTRYRTQSWHLLK
jgi:hypothetical protein